MARKRVDLAAVKAKKQKKIAIVGFVLLLGLMAFSVPKTLKSLKGPPPPTPPTAQPAPATTPGTTPPPAPAGTTPTDPAAPPAAAPTGSAELVDTGAQPEAGDGQLVSFDRFESKDPFAPQVDPTPKVPEPAAPTAEPAPADPGAAPTVPAVDVPAKPPTTVPTAPQPAPAPTPEPEPETEPAPLPTSAVIAVNGVNETVKDGATFPSEDPVFELVSLAPNEVKIGIAGGSLTGGAKTVTLKKGKKVTLVNTADGTRFELVLVSLA